MDVFPVVRDANPDRNFTNLHRRLIKLMEEVGEISEAYLGVTASHNHKDMSLDDLREEMVDAVIVAIDILLTPFPDETEVPLDDIEALFATKLVKWEAIRKAAKAPMTKTGSES